MVEPLAAWPRPYYQPGAGDALIFFVVFGRFGDIGPVSRSQYRCDGIPDSLSVTKCGPDSHADEVNRFREGPMWDLAKREDQGISDEISRARECIVIRGEVPDPSELNYLRDVVGFITYLLDNGGIAVYDPQRFKYWSASEWREKLFDIGDAAPLAHTIILFSDEGDGTKWFHTRGLRKFGRADLSVHHVPSDREPAVQDLLNRFIVFQAEGGVIADGQEIKMKSLPAGLRCYVTGDLDDPDFNNIHVEIGVPGSTGAFGFKEALE